MSDLRESGSIEQDADMVILLHREDAYEKESPRAGEADLIVAKHRNGPTATITVAFQGHYTRFVDMANNFLERLCILWDDAGVFTRNDTRCHQERHESVTTYVTRGCHHPCG